MKQTTIPMAICPHCGYHMDRATDPFEAGAPKPDDLSVCVKCGELSMFDEELKQRPLKPEETARCSLDPRVITVQLLIRGMKRHKNKERTNET
jgi:hypothetical protein